MKAYKLTANIENEPWHWSEIIVYANSAGEAKSKGLNQFEGAEVFDYRAHDCQRDVKYTDLKARRIPEFDKADYGGAMLTKSEIREREWCEKRDLNAFNFTVSNPSDLFLVWAGVYGCYWGANRSGYTSNIELAGKYSAQEAYEIVRGSDYSRQENVVLLSVAEYNKNIDDKIKKLKECRL